MSADDFFEKKYLALYAPLSRFVWQLVQDERAAEDLVQETFLQAWNEREDLAGHPNADGWFYLTARNYAMNYLRLSRHKDAYELDDEEKPDVYADPENVEESVLGTFFRFSELAELLGPEEIALLRLRFDQGFEVKEIAREKGLSEGACKMRFARIFAKLRKHPEIFTLLCLVFILWNGGV